MRPYLLSLAALATVLLCATTASAAPCPPDTPDYPKYNAETCYQNPIVQSVGTCVGYTFIHASMTQQWVAETVACL